MTNIWVVRAGEGNEAVEGFKRDGVVAYGGSRIGDLRNLGTRERIAEKVAEAYPAQPGAIANWAAQYWKIFHVIRDGDMVLTPIKATREIMMGTIAGDYEFRGDRPGGYPHVRKVTWFRTVTRDVFPPATRNALGSTLSIFNMNHHSETIDAIFNENAPQHNSTVVETEASEATVDLYAETKSKADEIIADRLHKRDPYEMQDLVAAVLRAMGMRTKVSSPGPDRGVDIVAYPDALGFGTPRIKVQVKHRRDSATGPELRNFMSTLGDGDKGLFVSTGGFTREALDEPERRGKPVTLLDQDAFIELMLEHYENLETAFQAWIPLRRIYIPVESED